MCPVQLDHIRTVQPFPVQHELVVEVAPILFVSDDMHRDEAFLSLSPSVDPFTALVDPVQTHENQKHSQDHAYRRPPVPAATNWIETVSGLKDGAEMVGRMVGWRGTDSDCSFGLFVSGASEVSWTRRGGDTHTHDEA